MTKNLQADEIVQGMAYAAYSASTLSKKWNRPIDDYPFTDEWIRDTSTAIRWLQSAGYRIVPVRPTAEMVEAGADVAESDSGTLETDIYRAMLDAAPEVLPAKKATGP